MPPYSGQGQAGRSREGAERRTAERAERVLDIGDQAARAAVAAAREDAMATHQMASVVIERAAQMMVRATRRGGGRDPRTDPQA